MKHFQLAEFDSPDAPGSGKLMQPTFLALLDKAREMAGVPFEINSGYRTPAHNKSVGGKEDSAHTRGFAADIKVESSAERFAILKAVIEAGFTRIGVGKTFIHVDSDPSLPANVIWLYP